MKCDLIIISTILILDPPPERYWELLAEERRLALQEALEENERVSLLVFTFKLALYAVQLLSASLNLFVFYSAA